QDSIFMLIVQKENTNMIETKLFTDHLCKAEEKRAFILNGGGRTCHLRDRFELPGPSLITLVRQFQFSSTTGNAILKALIKLLQILIGSHQILLAAHRPTCCI